MPREQHIQRFAVNSSKLASHPLCMATLSSQITMTAKLDLHVNIYLCPPLISLEMSISKRFSLFKSYVCVFSVQPNSSAVLQLLQLLTIHLLMFRCKKPLNRQTVLEMLGHCIIYTACTCASKHDPCF